MKSFINKMMLPVLVALCLSATACAERPTDSKSDKNQTTSANTKKDEQEASKKDSSKDDSKKTGEDKNKENADQGKGASANGAAGDNGKKSDDKQSNGKKTSETNATPQKQPGEIINELVNGMASVKSDVTSTKNELKKQTIEIASIKEASESNYLYVIITFIIAIVGLAIAFVNFFNVKNLTTRINRHRGDINELKSKDFKQPQTQQHQQPRNGKPQQSAEVIELQRRVAELESKLAALTKAEQPQPKSSNNSQKSRHAYFGLPTSNGSTRYFSKEEASREGVWFEASISGTTASFRPCVDCQSLTSFDALDKAIDFQGVLKSEATSMRVNQPGMATFKGGKWVIIKNAVVVLSK